MWKTPKSEEALRKDDQSDYNQHYSKCLLCAPEPFGLQEVRGRQFEGNRERSSKGMVFKNPKRTKPLLRV